jgi:CubicO group peptidase (beta-lactamase class C family)
MSGEHYAIVRSDKLVDENRSATVVPWFSFAKTIIAAAALTLVRDGMLQLDAPIKDARYTLRQLLQHRAGLPDYGPLREYHEAVAKHDQPWSQEELLARARADQLRYEPGQGWGYSNIGYLLVRRLIARIADAPFETVLNRCIFGPLRIETARLATTPADLTEVEMGEAQDYHPGWVYHGLLVGSLRDAALLLDRLLGGDLLPPVLLAEMQRGYPVNADRSGRPWQTPHYGLGLMIEEPDGPLGHTGGGAGSVIAVYRSRGNPIPLTQAMFAPGDDTGSVERLAFAKVQV